MPWNEGTYTPVDPHWGLQGSGHGNVLRPTQEMIGISQGKAIFTAPPNSPEAIEIAALRELREGLTGIQNDFLRMMIDNRITAIRAMYSSRGRTPASAYKDIGDMLPEWMKPYIQEGTAYGQAEGLDFGRHAFNEPRQPRGKGVSGGGGQLSPLGAQAELTAEQQQFMSGYLGWAKAGQPSGRGFGSVSSRRNSFVDLIKSMAASQGSQWAEYSKQSQSMFPSSQRLGAQRRIASQ